MSVGTMKFSKTQEKILLILRDGRMHLVEDMTKSLGISNSTLHAHMHKLRKKLNPRGRTITCRGHNNKRYYQLAQIIIDGE